MGNSASNFEDLDKKATQLLGELRKHPLMGKLILLQQGDGENYYKLYSILKSRMLPCEVVYFIEKMLPAITSMKSNGGSYVQDAVIVKHMAYIEIYKKLIDNADEIAKDIDTALKPPKGGKRKRMSAKSGKN
jgi:hypothetical protein